MRVLVTGGAGFIGSHVVDGLLAGGHQVAVLDDLSSGSRENLAQQAKFYEADIRDRDRVLRIFEEFRPEGVSHQAAQLSVSRSVREPAFDASVNVIGMLNVLDAAVASGVQRFAFASSGGVLYGETTVPATEDTPANPVSPYGITKWTGENYLRFYLREHQLRSVALRYANAYGERQNPHGEAGVVAIFSQKLLRGETPRINGDGRYVRDYVHVADVVQANLHALLNTNSDFEAVNVGTGLPTDVNELELLIRSACQRELAQRGRTTTLSTPEYGPARAGDLRSNLVSSDRAQALWGWRPGVELSTGLARTVAWFAQQELG